MLIVRYLRLKRRQPVLSSIIVSFIFLSVVAIVRAPKRPLDPIEINIDSKTEDSPCCVPKYRFKNFKTQLYASRRNCFAECTHDRGNFRNLRVIHKETFWLSKSALDEVNRPIEETTNFPIWIASIKIACALQNARQTIRFTNFFSQVRKVS